MKSKNRQKQTKERENRGEGNTQQMRSPDNAIEVQK